MPTHLQRSWLRPWGYEILLGIYFCCYCGLFVLSLESLCETILHKISIWIFLVGNLLPVPHSLVGALLLRISISSQNQSNPSLEWIYRCRGIESHLPLDPNFESHLGKCDCGWYSHLLAPNFSNTITSIRVCQITDNIG